MGRTISSLSRQHRTINRHRPTPIPSPQPLRNDPPPTEISKDQILNDLRTLASETPTNRQPTLIFHLFNFIHQQEEPNTPPLNHLINFIDTLLTHATPLHQAHLSIGLYILIQMVKTNDLEGSVQLPNGFRFIHRQPASVQTSETSTSRDSTPPPPLEPFSPTYSPTTSTESLTSHTTDDPDSDKENIPTRHAIQLRYPYSDIRSAPL